MKFTQIIILFTLISCQTTAPSFQENNAYQLLLKQCDFGPRNPGSEGYESCKNMIIETMKSYADTVIYQGFTFKEQKNNISYKKAKIKLEKMYKNKKNTIEWYSLDYWGEILEINLGNELF